MQYYTQQEGKVISTGGIFTHVMALSLNPKTHYQDGLIRCITSREGGAQETAIHGQTDRSALYKVIRDSEGHYTIVEKISFLNEEAVMTELLEPGLDFIGFEDPDIWVDETIGLVHVYFTIPLIDAKKVRTKIHLGHACGEDLDHLEMTTPALVVGNDKRAKELSIAPLNKQGFRYNLFESSDRVEGINYSVIRVAIAHDMATPWQFGEIAFHPKDCTFPWIAGHASPGPLFPRTFLDIGPNKLIGLINGCEANKYIDGKKVYGTFAIGLFIYNFDTGKIEWVSPEPVIQDSEVSKIRAITFASQFVETGVGRGTVYAHVNDSFVRAYTVEAAQLRLLLPQQYQG